MGGILLLVALVVGAWALTKAKQAAAALNELHALQSTHRRDLTVAREQFEAAQAKHQQEFLELEGQLAIVCHSSSMCTP
jgi:hypothetical protein